MANIGQSLKKVAQSAFGNLGVGINTGFTEGEKLLKSLAAEPGAAKVVASPLDTPAPVLPSPDDDAAQVKRRRSLSAQIARRGRASTILTSDNTERLGS